MATVRMKRGDKYADVFDSPDTIKQAQLDGYTLVETKKTEPVKQKKSRQKKLIQKLLKKKNHAQSVS